jgi:hypothetical protein
MAVLMKKNNQLVNVGYSIKQGELVQNKLPSVVDKSVTTITADDLQGATKIGRGVFRGCTSLTSVILPNTVTSIELEAFYECTGLTSISIPTSVASIGSNVFYSCSGLTSISIPTSVTSIGGYTFANCTGLTSISIPTGITSIGQSLLYGCTSLTTIILPSTITSIDFYAFKNCTSLTGITIYAITPPSLAMLDVFSNTNNCPIYVPAESVEAYKTATNWSMWASRIQAIPT